MTGNIPSEFGKIQSLQRAKFGSNKFQGNLPKEFSSISGIKLLSFGTCIYLFVCIYE